MTVGGWISEQNLAAGVGAALVGGLDEADELDRLLGLDGRLLGLEEFEDSLGETGEEALGLGLSVHMHGVLFEVDQTVVFIVAGAVKVDGADALVGPDCRDQIVIGVETQRTLRQPRPITV